MCGGIKERAARTFRTLLFETRSQFPFPFFSIFEEKDYNKLISMGLCRFSYTFP